MPTKAKPPSLTKTEQSEAPQIPASTKDLENSAAKQETVAPTTKGGAPPSSSVQSSNKFESTSSHGKQNLVADDKK
jgi:hypothetical protein